jgi:hypothetical protein
VAVTAWGSAARGSGEAAANRRGGILSCTTPALVLPSKISPAFKKVFPFTRINHVPKVFTLL